ncbi:helix-turn-helix domain-containing protein [Limosilactobacillus vaginalis]|uniref:Helix-turn-helix domain-containing protein n=1 Tax=Limosilactobacillus vaginalis TaxID=1633 RepID=A0AAW5WSH0_9LACO|nr:helix-turn-helix domain-containing protein [Limosilactobacillus vaginalis]
MNITPQSIHNWEVGKSMPNSEAIYKMAKILGTSTDNIFLALNTTKVVRK